MPKTICKSAEIAPAASMMPIGGGSGCKRVGAGAGCPSMSFCLYLKTGVDLMLAIAHSFS